MPDNSITPEQFITVEAYPKIWTLTLPALVNDDLGEISNAEAEGDPDV
jgi:hypothetical protein